MLTEVAIVLGATLVACGLLTLGVLELVWPTRRRGPSRRPTGTRPATAAELAPASEPASPLGLVGDPEDEETEGVVARDLATTRGPAPEGTAVEAGAQGGPTTGDVTPRDEGEAAADPSLLERCEALASDEQWDSLLAAAMPALGPADPAGPPSSARAQLWSLVGRAHAGHGNQAAAVNAFRAAMTIAPEAEHRGYQEEFVSVVTATARTFVTESSETSHDAARLEKLGAARAVLLAALADVADEPSLTLTLARIDGHYWPFYEAHARTLLAADEATQAAQLADDALADPSLPQAHRAAFEALRAETLAGRIAELTATATRSMGFGRDWDAVAALERAEAILRSARNVPSERMAEIATPLAATFTRLGVRRVEAREFEDALEPLLRALRLPGVGPGDADEARWALSQAIEGLVDARTSMIREVAGEGHRASATAQAEKLWGIVRNGIAAGVPQERLQRAMVTVRGLLEELGETPA